MKNISINNILLGCLVSILIWLGVETALAVRSTRQGIKPILINFQASTEEIKQAAISLKETSFSGKEAMLSFNELSVKQKELLLNEKTQRSFGLLLRSGDDLARTIIKVNNILDDVKEKTLPKTNIAIDSGTKTLQSANTVLLTAGGSLDQLTNITERNLEQLRVLISDPNITIAIAGIAEASKVGAKTVESVELSAEEIRKAIPELTMELTQIARNSDSSTAEIAKFLKHLNKPVSRKEKVFRFIIEAILKSSPALLRR